MSCIFLFAFLASDASTWRLLSVICKCDIIVSLSLLMNIQAMYSNLVNNLSINEQG